MNGISKAYKVIFIVFLLLFFIPAIPGAEGNRQIKVCVTVPDLGNLVNEIGGDLVSVTVFAKGTEDPHFVEAKPSFIKILSTADLYIQMGMELEIGWAPVLIKNSRNGKILLGTSGFLDTSQVISPLEIPASTIDRSMGDVHAAGNPHYLLDPLNALKVARLISDKLSELKPGKKKFFDKRYSDFYKKVGMSMVGEKLFKKYDFEKLALLFEYGKLRNFLKKQNDDKLLKGWLGLMAPYFGISVTADHNMWTYFARRFGLTVKGYMEPKPGVSPTTRHLTGLVKMMRTEKVGIVIVSSYFNPRYALFFSDKTGAGVVDLAHQVGSRKMATDYISMIDYNISQFQAAMRAK